MNVFLTGGTGYIGSSVLKQLIAEGHDVVALARTEAKAAVVEAAGATALIGDLWDPKLLQEAAERSDGVIHLATPGDESSASADDLAVGAIVAGLEDSGKPFVYTGGIWTYGNNSAITEESAPDPVELSAWRVPIEKWVREVEGMRTTIICPSVVYGHGGGLPNLIVHAPLGHAFAAALHLIGDGHQHWTSVHVDDLATLYVLALENAEHGSYYIADSGRNPTVRELGEAAAKAAGVAAGVEAETEEETRARLGILLADALLLDQQTKTTKARVELGWEPNGPSLLDEISTGSYAPER